MARSSIQSVISDRFRISQFLVPNCSQGKSTAPQIPRRKNFALARYLNFPTNWPPPNFFRAALGYPMYISSRFTVRQPSTLSIARLSLILSLSLSLSVIIPFSCQSPWRGALAARFVGLSILPSDTAVTSVGGNRAALVLPASHSVDVVILLGD